MASVKELFKSADWKAEKHVPAIDAPDSAVAGSELEITVTVGKEIAHPNTTEHFIAWIDVYFQPEGSKFPYQLARTEFAAHGASAEGPNTSTVYALPSVKIKVKTEKPGTIFATSYCNIHGLWESSKELKVS